MSSNLPTLPAPATSPRRTTKYRNRRADLLDPAAEQRALLLSIVATAFIGMMGIGGGLVIGSRAILFDGMYSVVDILLTCGALGVSKLVIREPSQHFQFGYWHLEPVIGAIQSAILATACLYGVANAVQGLIGGGYDVDHGYGAVWAAVMGASGVVMALYIRRIARLQRSLLLEVDYRSWLLSGLLSLTLLVAYGIALALADTPYRQLVPYIDPAMLLILCLALLPMPLKILFDTSRDILRVAPQELDAKVRAVMDELVEERGYLNYTSYVSQVGRVRFVEIHILVPPGFHVGTVDEVDALRHLIATRLDATWPEVWLTVDMTAKPKWI